MASVDAIKFSRVALFLTLISLVKSDEVIKALETQGAELSLDSFVFDTILEQKVDKTNKISMYKLLTTQEVIYSRDEDDTDKEVIALKDTEDKIGHKRTKRIYIVLRKKTAGFYYVTAAAVRDASDLDKTSQTKVSIGGSDKVIEWLAFDTHLFPRKSTLMLSTYFCVTTFVAACFFNASVLIPPEKFIKSPPTTKKQIHAAEANNLKLITTDGSDGDDSYDFYGDLEFHAQEGRIFGLVTGIVGMSFGLACGVVGAVLGAGCPNMQSAFGLGGGTDTTVVVQQQAPIGIPVAGGMGMGVGVGGMAPTMIPGSGGVVMGSGPAMDAYTANTIQNAMMGRRKRQTVDSSVDYPGFYTQFINPTPESTLAHEGEIFYGFGNCPPSTIDPKSLESATTNEEVINFYLKVLRADCLVDRITVINKLVGDGTIKVEDKILHMNLNNPKLLQKKIGLKESFELTGAAELYAFSHTYREDQKNGINAAEKFTNPDGSGQISRTINFMTRLVVKFIKETRTRARPFMIYLSRYLVLILKSVLDKLHEDQQNLMRCPTCTKDQEINKNDRIQIIGLLEFIRHGLKAVDQGQDPHPIFNEFFKKNSDAIHKLSNLYT